MHADKVYYFLFFYILIFFYLSFLSALTSQSLIKDIIRKLDRTRVLKDAERFLLEKPITITSFKAERNKGGLYDLYSEGDYWWPNPADPHGPYIRKDGYTNPENFVAHRDALRRLSIQAPALVAAFKMTESEKYAQHAIEHIIAWFADEGTMMNPNMLYALTGKWID